jgi:hypothetical protein
MTTHTSEPTKSLRGDPHGVERMLTIAAAAGALGIHPWALRRAIKSGLIPAYAPFNGRKLVRLSEVVAAIDASKIGGTE